MRVLQVLNDLQILRAHRLAAAAFDTAGGIAAFFDQMAVLPFPFFENIVYGGMVKDAENTGILTPCGQGMQ